MSSNPSNNTNTNSENPVPSAAMIAIAAEMGITVDEMVARFAQPSAPTVDKHAEDYLAMQTPATRRTYATHINRLRRGIGPICDQECAPCMDRSAGFVCQCSCSKCVNSRITVEAQGGKLVGPETYSSAHVEQLSKIALRIAVKSGIFDNQVRAERGLAPKPADGHNAAETAVHATRSLYGKALMYLGGVNPGLEVKRPRRSCGKRRPLQPFELMELHHVTATGGDDPELDELLLDLAIQTGVRREGALELVVGRLYRSRQMIGVTEKYGMQIETPVSIELIDRLLAHAIRRGGSQCDPSSSEYVANSRVFWRHGHPGFVPITSRRFDTLISRWQHSLPFANEERVGFHHVRHTMGAFLERHYGTAVKAAYLRHTVADATAVYGHCTVERLAEVLSEVFTFEHPLAQGREKRRKDTMKRFGLESN